MEAQIAMVRLSDGDHYEFLNLLEKPLSIWEQITLHELLIQHNLRFRISSSGSLRKILHT